jgi:hypothetical protein
VLPRPLAGGQSPGLTPGRSFTIRMSGHTRIASSVRSVVSGIVHPRTWTLNGSHEGLTALVWGRYSGPSSVARRAGPPMMGSWATPDRDRLGPSPPRGARAGRVRVGVVKLLRARGGCLGVIRWRAWKAAIGPGELPNERRSRNARWRPGELKHLSTRRKRNQPRLPQ